MGTRGPKSAAEMAVAPLDEARKRPPPPESLTKDQADVWRRTVAALPSGWIQPEHFEIMAAFCRHAVRFRDLSQRLDNIDVEKIGMLTGGMGIDTYSKLRRAAESESRAMLAAARSLRITIQATMRPETAGRRASRPEIPASWNGERKPWERT